MTTDPYGQWTGTDMAERDVEDLLEAADWGVLSLADGDVPYSIPVSFGYTDSAVYFGFVRDDPSNEKFAFVDDGSRARLLVTDVRAKYDWQSVAVTGPVRAIGRDEDHWDAMLVALEDNPWFSPVSDTAEETTGLQGWRLVPDGVRGVEVSPRQE